MQRRLFLKNTGLAAAALGLSIWNEGCTPIQDFPKYSGRRLILVKLAGGNDGLFSLMPREHDQIERLRPNMAAKAKKNGIPLFNDWLLNYELRSLETLLGQGELTILPFVGYPEPNTSHFKSTEIWETGALPGEQSGKFGWIGQLLDNGTLSVEGNDTPVLSLSDLETLVIRGRMKQGHTWLGNTTLEWYEDDILEWLKDIQQHAVADKLLKEYNLMNFLRESQKVSGFPATALGDQFGRVAAIIQQDKPYKVFYTTHSDYDTHVSAPERLTVLYEELSAALISLTQSLKNSGHWNETLIVVYSEFGRTIDENANGGTDHGAAGLCMLLGSNQIVKKYSNLTPEINLVPYCGEMYLAHQTDFRDIYADIRREWLL